MDPAWTAADMEERIGRTIRQGNTFDTVDVVNLVARRSYDAMMTNTSPAKPVRATDPPRRRPRHHGRPRRRLRRLLGPDQGRRHGDPVFVQQVEADQHVTTCSPAATRAQHQRRPRRHHHRPAPPHRRRHRRPPGLRADSHRAAAWLGTDRTRRLWDFPDGRTVPDSEPGDLVTALTRQLKAANPVVTRENTHVTLAASPGFALTVTYHQQTSTYAVALTAPPPATCAATR